MTNATRVIDLIAQLQAHDPVAPLEVWREEKEGAKSRIMRYKVLGVQQITPITLKAKGLSYEPSDENPPLPVVVFIEGLTSEERS